jgi:hypothetical protein
MHMILPYDNTSIMDSIILKYHNYIIFIDLYNLNVKQSKRFIYH